MIELFYLTLDGILTGTSTPGQSRPVSIGSKGELHIIQIPELKGNHQMRISVIRRTWDEIEE